MKILKNKVVAISLIILIVILFGYFVYKMMENIGNPKVELETTKGKIIIELYSDKAPITVTNFLKYVKEGYYDGLVFHRVINGFMIQTGGFNEQGQEKQTKEPIKLESNNGLKNNVGYIAMARTSIPDSATSQFFINAADNDFLNYNSINPGYAVFGKVIEGMDVVKEIENSQTTNKFKMDDWPVEDIKIISARII